MDAQKSGYDIDITVYRPLEPKEVPIMGKTLFALPPPALSDEDMKAIEEVVKKFKERNNGN